MEQIERVRMIHEKFAEGCKFSFNYNTLLLTASILAGLGLVSDSSTTVIASMLVSPIMGPVVGMAYGATIRDWRLFRTAFRTEIFSLVFCILVGALLGACVGPTDLGSEWPTKEMFVRGTWQNFLVALPVAFFSGLGVAVSLLDDQTSSLVGVAISASLLPPAVNAGILWVAYWFSQNDWVGILPPAEIYPTNPLETYAPGPDPYSDTPEAAGDSLESLKEFSEAGLVSLSLTLANIVLIMISSMLMFRMKEVSS
jgi:uncharacterized hydrophobic protein (TIGR00271 family)